MVGSFGGPDETEFVGRSVGCCARAVALVLWPLLPGPVVQHRASAADPINPDEAALMVLSSGQRAYNEHNYQAAADRFREFLRQYGGRREAPPAQYGLGMSLLELPRQKFH